MLKAGLTLAALAAAMAISLAPVRAETRWDMPTPYPDANFHTQNDQKFAEDVKKLTDGGLVITVHSAGSLIKHAEIKNGVRSGQAQIGEILLSLLSNENALFDDAVPFFANSYDAAWRLWQASRKPISELLARQNLVVLYAVAWPPQGLYSSREIRTIADMKGLKFRAYNTTTERIAQLTGAIPTQIEVPDIPQAFSTGRVQAMITSSSTGVNSKAWDYLKYYYDLQAWLPKDIIFVNKDAFDKLDDKTRSALLEAAAQAEKRGWELSKQENRTQLEVLARNGIKVEKPNAQLEASFRKIGETMTEEWVKRAGPAGKAVVEAYRK